MAGRFFYGAVIGLCAAISAAQAFAAITLDPVISGLSFPTYVTSPPSDERLFVTERGGAIKVFNNDGTALGTFMTVADVDTTQEGGLLGLAFHPGYAINGFFVVSYTARLDGQFTTIVERYRVNGGDPNVADQGSGKVVMTIPQPDTNHNAGWIGFSPSDGYLYIPLGDGGGGHDTFNNGQNVETLLGSIVRIIVELDADGGYQNPVDNPFVDKPGRDEVWAYGVRNPWRAGFDRQTGEFYFGDVGQRTWEEINLGVKQGNFGWPLREGFVATPTGGVGGELASRVDPLYAYLNGAGPRSVVGGVVYRGAAADLYGKYLFAEFYTGEIWRMDKDGSNVERIDDDFGFSGTPVGFGEDGNGDVYLVDFDGRVLRFGGDVAMPAAKSVPAMSPAVVVMLAASMVVIVVAAVRETG